MIAQFVVIILLFSLQTGMMIKMVAISRSRSSYLVVVNFVREGNLKCHPHCLQLRNRTRLLREKRLPFTLQVEYYLTKAQKRAEIHNPLFNELEKFYCG